MGIVKNKNGKKSGSFIKTVMETKMGTQKSVGVVNYLDVTFDLY